MRGSIRSFRFESVIAMAASDAASFGHLLRRYRIAAALSQEALAERSGVSVRAISDLERGVSEPRLETIRLLAESLGLDDATRSMLIDAARTESATPPASPPAGRERSPGDESREVRSGRVPTPPTPMIGRDADLRRVVSLYRKEGARLVTLTGPGGVGKTRLALALGDALSRGDEHTLVFVDLAPLTDGSQVSSAIATAIGLRDTGALDLGDALRDYLASRRCFLILDNFEQVLSAAETVALLLRDCPEVRLLVTSREPLHVRGERELPVNPLEVPDAVTEASLAAIEENPSVSLFLSRVRDVRPDFALTPDNETVVANICRRLEGLPLAIELAAARIRLLSPAALLQRFDEQLGVLTDGPRDAPNRQRTLRDTIAWSYDLLAPQEQATFRRLAVFSGGFMLDGAAAVAGVGVDDAFGLVTSLVEKSLAQAVPFAGDETRFRMLETIREFGLEQLRAADEEDDARRRHFGYYLELAMAFDDVVIWGGDYVSWFPRLDAELDNLRSALAFGLSNGAGEPTLRFAAALGGYFTARPLTEEAATLMLAALAGAPDAPPDLLVSSMFLAGMYFGSTNRLEEGFRLAAEALSIAEASNDSLLLGIAHSIEGMLWEWQGDCLASERAHRAGLAAIRQKPLPGWLMLELGELGDKLVTCGPIEEGIALLDEAFALAEEHRQRWNQSWVRGLQGYAALALEDLNLARLRFRQSLEISREVDDLRLELGAVMGYATLALADGRPDDAARIIGSVDHTRTSHGIGRRLPYSLHDTQTISRLLDQLGEERYRELISEGKTAGYKPFVEQLLSENSLGSIARS
jgi:predicted ATPase/transcriptional regulator with XRE-family HTH domain